MTVIAWLFWPSVLLLVWSVTAYLLEFWGDPAAVRAVASLGDVHPHGLPKEQSRGYPLIGWPAEDRRYPDPLTFITSAPEPREPPAFLLRRNLLYPEDGC